MLRLNTSCPADENGSFVLQFDEAWQEDGAIEGLQFASAS